MNKIACRAQVSEDCYDGRSTSVQFAEDEPMSGDGTYDGATIVCDPCFILVAAMSPSGRGLFEELTAVISHLRDQLKYIKRHPNPEELAAEARRASDGLEAFVVPSWKRSALTLAKLAEREVERRKG